ncbi:hypothetical protein PIB30_017079 [Stylosanthes scabra]|uniref:Uncharacterized protein n=1 Tax=Stylosanthes scabra TaxID=79078 RepID=A0ABU6T7B5_9FABA|nr:hypothetical protein [Stylosanthes scabra]
MGWVRAHIGWVPLSPFPSPFIRGDGYPCPAHPPPNPRGQSVVHSSLHRGTSSSSETFTAATIVHRRSLSRSSLGGAASFFALRLPPCVSLQFSSSNLVSKWFSQSYIINQR